MTFKKQFLYKDESWYNKRKQDHLDSAKLFNNCIAEVQRLFNRKLTPEEKEDILAKGWEHTSELIKAESQFPNGKIETILELEGKDPTKAIELLNTAKNKYLQDVFDFKDDEIVVSKRIIDNVDEIGFYYTKNEKQNNALSLAKQLSDILNEAIDKNIIYTYMYDGSNAVKRPFRELITYGKTPNNKSGFAPNPEQIFQIK